MASTDKHVPEVEHNDSKTREISSVIDAALRETLPGQQKALSGISLRAFILGLSLGLSSSLTAYFMYTGQPIWRASFFIASLSLFHFLEYYMTALVNTRYANTSAFLLSTNGRAYNLAHSLALLECVVTSLFFEEWQETLSTPMNIAIGLSLMIMGQLVRSLAMYQAGTNFNHIVQTRKDESHRLVTTGLYRILRHPSYFGFFWWGLGTQVVLGNGVCLLGYAVVLWNFFRLRITKEEEHLVKFFGKQYEDYRVKTQIGIPLLR